VTNFHPEYEAAAFLKDKIETALGGSISGAFLDLIPQEAALPAVRFSFMSRDNTMTNGQAIVISRLRAQVLAVAVGEPGDVEPIATSLVNALHKSSGLAPGGLATVLACTFLEPLTMTERDRGGSIVRHGGGVFEVVLQVANNFQ
jgi:hypothetical protein